MNRLLVTIALGASIVSTQALAQQGGGDGRGWAQRDMTRAEAKERADSIFQRLDVNHTGVVTRQQAEQAAQQMGFGGERAQKMIDRAFGTAQSLTLQQFEAQELARFDRDDLNHDGTVTAAERQQVRAELKAQRAAAAQPQGQPAPQ
jgi:Ca2+-binding EF-hand superfamily protein